MLQVVIHNLESTIHVRAMCSPQSRFGGLSQNRSFSVWRNTVPALKMKEDGSRRLGAVHCSFYCTSPRFDFEGAMHGLRFTCTILPCCSSLWSLGVKNFSKPKFSGIFLTSSSESQQLVCCEVFRRSSVHAWRQIWTGGSNAC
jgi:hypothetical protein